MRVAILSSGGKDSSYATWWSTLQGWEVVSLVTVGVSGEDSFMFQIQNTAIAGLHSYSMGVPWLPVISDGKENLEIADLENAILGKSDPKDDYERFWPKTFKKPEMMDIYEGRLDVDALVVGALRSDYQKKRIEMMCERIGIHSFCPLWHKDPGEHMRSLIDHGFEVIFTSISSQGLDEGWIGRSLTHNSLDKLEKLSEKYRFNLDGEGGEFETIVTNAPHLSEPIILEWENIWDGKRGEMSITYCGFRHR